MRVVRINVPKKGLSNKDKEHIILLHNDAVTEAENARLGTKAKGSLIGAATGVGLTALAKKYAKNSSDKHALAKGLLTGGFIGRLASEIPAMKKSKKYIDAGRKEIDDFSKADRKTRDSMMENYMPLRLKMKEDKLNKKIQSKDKNFSTKSKEESEELRKNWDKMTKKEKEHAGMMYLDSDLAGKREYNRTLFKGSLIGTGIGLGAAKLAKKHITKGKHGKKLYAGGYLLGSTAGSLAFNKSASKKANKYWDRGDKDLNDFVKADKATKQKMMKEFVPLEARMWQEDLKKKNKNFSTRSKEESEELRKNWDKMTKKEKEHAGMMYLDSDLAGKREYNRTLFKGSLIGTGIGLGAAKLAKKHITKGKHGKKLYAGGYLLGSTAGSLAFNKSASKKANKYWDRGDKDLNDFVKADKATKQKMMKEFVPLEARMWQEDLKK